MVIAIISLLVSILLPSLNKAKDLARTVACMANFKAIQSASMLYAAENDDFVPPTRWHKTGARHSWVNFLTDNDLIGFDAVMCPSASNDVNANAYDYPLAYWQNDYIGGVRSLALAADDKGSDNFAGTQLAKLPSPATRVLYQPGFLQGASTNTLHNDLRDAEAAGGIGGSLGFTYRDWIPFDGNLTARHDDKAPVAMVDGHVETHFREDLVPPGGTDGDEMFRELWQHLTSWPSWD